MPMMGFYGEWVVPALIDLSMRNERLRPYRERVAGAAEGRILDAAAVVDQFDQDKIGFRATGCHRTARTMSGIPMARGNSQ
jgi:hypothetical protein